MNSASPSTSAVAAASASLEVVVEVHTERGIPWVLVSASQSPYYCPAESIESSYYSPIGHEHFGMELSPCRLPSSRALG